MTSVKRPAASPLPRPVAGPSGSARATARTATAGAHRDYELLDAVQVGTSFQPPLAALSFHGEDFAPAQTFALGETAAEVRGGRAGAEVNDSQLAQGPGRSILVRGSAAFVEKALGALKELAETKAGKALLTGLDSMPRKVMLVETSDGNYARAEKLEDAWLREDGKRGKGCDSTVYFNPSREVIGGGTEKWMTRPPVVGLFHELRHAYFYGNGLLQPGDTGLENNRELAVVGHPYDHDGDPKTPPVVPPQPTENALRAELKLPLRPFGQANPIDRPSA